MAIAPQPTTALRIIADHYLDDHEYLQHHREREQRRRESLPGIQRIIDDFVQARTDIKTFRQQLDEFLRQSENDHWGTKGFWMMTLNQLAKYHDAQTETQLRATLNGLNASNVSERFEQFAQFLESDRQRFADRKRSLAAPGKSPFFISLFAVWLDPNGGVFVAWPTLREGLRVLLDRNALPVTDDLVRTSDDVRIATAQDYAAVKRALNAVAAAAPDLVNALFYWDERFLSWVRDHKQEIPDWLEEDEPDIATFPDTHLKPIPRARLDQQIRALRRQLLVPDDVIRRIYHALVLGQHVILSGPPGTGKTQLATLLPRELWLTQTQGEIADTPYTTSGTPFETTTSTEDCYTVRVVTATDEWTPRQVIGGIVPVTENDRVRYTIAYGCLAQAIMENWQLDADIVATWSKPQRRMVRANHGSAEQYRGAWLVIDEFNRAPIDLALGEALTAIGGGQGGELNVPIASGSAALPIPQDFRIIGTLNTFDRHFLNQISEALKRRFAFIEVLPPAREERAAEQSIVLHKVLRQLAAINGDLIRRDRDTIGWQGLVTIEPGDDNAPWRLLWHGRATPIKSEEPTSVTTILQEATAAQRIFDEGWRLFEVIRLYRQFGTAQAIAWTLKYLGAGLLDELDLNDEAGWRRCLGIAFADTLADQLQILFPDEIEALLAYLRSTDAPTFAAAYGRMLGNLISPKRRNAQMLALGSIKNDVGQPYLSVSEAQTIAQDENGSVPEATLATLFHADQSRNQLPQFAERLERFLFERTI
jgi:MoxR-like ATPase